MNDNSLNTLYDDKFYNDQIKFYTSMLNDGDGEGKIRARKALLHLKGKLKFELRQADERIADILNKSKYE